MLAWEIVGVVVLVIIGILIYCEISIHRKP